MALMHGRHANVFRGVSVHNDNFELSHLFYVNDIINMMCDWRFGKCKAIVRILRFYPTS